jgi:hypothetical protein
MAAPALRTTLIHQGVAALDRLRELDLDAAWLSAALVDGLTRAQATASEVDPPQFGGLLRYVLLNRALREAAVPNGWALVNGLPPSIRAPGGNHSLVFYFGDAGTGMKDSTPSNLYGKGPTLAEMLAANQGFLFPDLREEIVAEPQVIQTWVLLTHQVGDELHAEVSLPRGSSSGFIDSWSERIILPAIPLAAGSIVIPIEPTPAIDVPVHRRS